MSDNQPSAWAVGWSGFAGFMLILAGIIQGLNGLSAIINDQFFVKLPELHVPVGCHLRGAGST